MTVSSFSQDVESILPAVLHRPTNRLGTRVWGGLLVGPDTPGNYSAEIKMVADEPPPQHQRPAFSFLIYSRSFWWKSLES